MAPTLAYPDNDNHEKRKNKMRIKSQRRFTPWSLLGITRPVFGFIISLFVVWWLVIFRLTDIGDVSNHRDCFVRGGADGGASKGPLNATASGGEPPLKLSLEQRRQLELEQYNRHHHAIVIPFRDREHHLKLFIERMGPYLKRNFPKDDFSLYIIEQADKNIFSRGFLINAGLSEVYKRIRDTHCVIVHDVDLLPKYDGVPYADCRKPIQLGSELEHFHWSYPYPTNAGGIVSMHMVDWQTINGMSNDYQGWGGEDDDLYLRLFRNGLLRNTHPDDPNVPEIVRPALGKGVFVNLEVFSTPSTTNTTTPPTDTPPDSTNASTTADAATATDESNPTPSFDVKALNNVQYNANMCVLNKMYAGSNRWKYDGLSDVDFEVLSNDIVRATEGADGFYEIHHIKVLAQMNETRQEVPCSVVPEDDNGQRNQPLEFVHITHTGGDIIERAGAQARLAWGACHYNHEASQEMECPSPPDLEGLVELKNYVNASPWHVPMHAFRFPPFMLVPSFTIVRNPYDRAIVLYFDKYAGYKGANQHDPANLNGFLQNLVVSEPGSGRIDFLPQHHYVFHGKERVVAHILHYETLGQDFTSLMEQYNLKVPLPYDFDPPPARQGGLDVKDLTDTTVKMINSYAADDFRLFGYEMKMSSS